MTPTTPFPLDLYRDLYRIRRVEERLAEVYPTDKIQSPMHLSIGQEIASVAVCSQLEPEDKVFGTYRGHALYLAKGGDLNAFVAELYGKRAGCTGGKGGSMHLADPDAGLIACSAIVGSTIPLAVGWALANKLDGRPGITVAFFGDGATEEGAFYESLNFAALHQLRVLFVCENNGYAIHSPTRSRQGSLAVARARGVLDGGAIWTTAQDGYRLVVAHAGGAVNRVRNGEPVYLEIQVARTKEHVGPGEDWSAGYRREEDDAPFRQADALEALERELPPHETVTVRAHVGAELDEAFAFAERAAFPTAADLMEGV